MAFLAQSELGVSATETGLPASTDNPFIMVRYAEITAVLTVDRKDSIMVTVSASEARANFPSIGARVYTTGEPVTVFKNSKPWVMITSVSEPPLSLGSEEEFWQRIEASRADVRAERVRDAALVEDELRAKYGLR